MQNCAEKISKSVKDTLKIIIACRGGLSAKKSYFTLELNIEERSVLNWRSQTAYKSSSSMNNFSFISFSSLEKSEKKSYSSFSYYGCCMAITLYLSQLKSTKVC